METTIAGLNKFMKETGDITLNLTALPVSVILVYFLKKSCIHICSAPLEGLNRFVRNCTYMKFMTVVPIQRFLTD